MEAEFSRNLISKVYDFNSFSSKGKCLIFNFENFSSGGKRRRLGSDKDAEYLKKVFTELQFDVTVHKDLYLKEMKQVINEASESDYSSYACFVCCVLTHGDAGKLHTKDGYILTDFLFSSFFTKKCPSLAEKPKLFFIQACQGDEYDGGVQLETADGELSFDHPQHIDFLIVHSTVQGYFSWRSPDLGSWFIQTLCLCYEYYKDEDIDLLQLLLKVNFMMAYKRESYTPSTPATHQKKQVPCIISTLRKKIIFSAYRSSFSANTIPNEAEDVVDKGIKIKKGSSQSNTNIGKLTVDEDSGDYHVGKPKHIKCIIFYNEDFKSYLDLKCLKGSATNATKVYYQLKEYGCSVNIVRNPTIKQINSALKQEIENASSKSDCFLCFIATRSDPDGFLYAKDGRYSKENIISFFSGNKCPVLASKPKIFIFQACVTDKDMDESADSDSMCTIPSQADFLLIDSALKDNYLTTSTRFIDLLCRALKESKNQVDFFEAMTFANGKILSDCDDNIKNESSLILTSTLTRRILFNIEK